jgi:hypothetical protein
MKIGILTFHFSNNYGALFQAYGLRNYLKGLGHEVEFIISFILVNIIVPLVYIYKYIDIQWQE